MEVKVNPVVERKFFRLKEAAKYYDMDLKTVKKLAINAEALYKVGGVLLVKFEAIDEFLETCKIIEED